MNPGTVNRASKKSLLTIRERVILHILAYQKFYQDADAPMPITQEGIAEAVDVGRNNVSKVVNALSEEDWVEIQTKHVKGFSSVKKVYYLTTKGFQEALALKADVENTPITIVDFDGKPHEDIVGKLSIYLPKRYSFLELALGVERGRFECASFHEGKIKDERRYVDYTDRKPAVRNFYGRAEELKVLNNFLNSESCKIMMVGGIPGIGKTTLLAKFVQDVREHRNVFWYRIHEWVTLKILLTPIAEFLSQLGKKGLERYLGRTETPNVGDVCSILESELKDVPAVFILDDVQKSDPNIISLLSALVGVLEHLPTISMICTSREIPSFYSRGAVFKGLVQELMLEGLDRESSLQLMRNRELPETQQDEIYRATKGHPLFLELIENPKSALGKNIRMFIEQEVYSKLDLTERRILEIASVFRYPVLIDAFFTMEEEISREEGGDPRELKYKDYIVDYDTIDTLQAKSLMHESMGRMIGMHDLLRDFFYSRLSPRQRVTYHKAASRYYIQDQAAPSQVEALYHSLAAKEYSIAIRIAAGNGRDIISKGYGLPFAPLLRSLLSQCTGIERSDKMEILLLEGEVQDFQGAGNDAISRFQDIISLASPERDKRIISEVNRRIGAIYLRRADFDEAQPFLDRSLNLANEINDPHTLIEVLYDLGGLMERRGRKEDALVAFTRSMELSKAVGDYVGLGKALYGLGRVYSNLFDHVRSVRYMKEALEVLEKTGDINELAKVYTSLGMIYLDGGKHEEALKAQEKAIGLAESSGNMSTLAYAMSNAGACHLEMDELEEAEELLIGATKIFEKLNDHLLTASMHLYRGYLYSKKKEWEWAKEEFHLSLDMLRRLNVPLKLGRWLFEIGVEYVKNEDYEEAKEMLREALAITDSEGQENLKKEVQNVMDSINA